jgi:hypothetical protein
MSQQKFIQAVSKLKPFHAWHFPEKKNRNWKPSLVEI